MRFPDEYLFSKEHTWAFVTKDTATIGITEFAAEELNDILAADLPQVGDEIDQGESFGTLESSKTVSDIYAPVSGEIIEVNELVINAPSLINEFPYDDGWLLKVQLTDKEELTEDEEHTSLFDSIKYEGYINEESADADGDDFDDDDDDDY